MFSVIFLDIFLILIVMFLNFFYRKYMDIIDQEINALLLHHARQHPE